MILILVTLYLALWAVLPKAPAPEPQKQLEWTTALMDEVRVGL